MPPGASWARQRISGEHLLFYCVRSSLSRDGFFRYSVYFLPVLALLLGLLRLLRLLPSLMLMPMLMLVIALSLSLLRQAVGTMS